MRTVLAALALTLLILPAMAGAGSGTGDGAWSPPPDARDRLERILEDPVFQLEEPEPGIGERIMARVREFLFGLFQRISSAVALNTNLVKALLWLVSILALAGAGWVIIRLTRDRYQAPGAGPTATRPDSAGPEQARSTEELLAGARQALRAGSGRKALRLCLEACLLALRQAGHLPDDRSMTDLEGAAALERSGPAGLREPFRTVAGTHDRVVYAGRQAGAGEVEEALDLATGIVRQDGER